MKPSATSRTVYYAVTALMAIVFILPLVWAVVSSISPNPGTAQTSGFGLGNYGTMLKYGLGIPVYLKNSIIVSVSATVFTLIVAATGDTPSHASPSSARTCCSPSCCRS